MSYILGIDPGVCNLAYCLINIKTEEIIKWDVVSIGTSKDPYEIVCKNLADKLIELDLLKNGPGSCEIKPEIIICTEIQPTSNIRTLVISGQIQMYFTLEKLKKNYDNHYKIKKIVGYHARNKLNYYEPILGDEPLKLDHLKKGYYKNKVTSKEHCKRVLVRKKLDNWLSFFLSHSKKDDLSDCALMCLAYIKFIIGPKNSSHTENELENPEKYPKKVIPLDKLCTGVTMAGVPCRYKKYKKSLYCKIHKPKI